MMPILLRFLKMLGGFVGLWLAIWLFNNFGCAKVEGGEMETTLKKESHKSIDAKIRSVSDLSVDDLVSFSYKQSGKGQEVWAARVIGLPGDRVEIRAGDVFVNGTKIGSNYVSPANKDEARENYAELIVPRESVYLLCDNRRAFDKSDSRGIGPVGLWAILGKFK